MSTTFAVIDAHYIWYFV